MKKQADWQGALLGSAAVGGGSFALGQLVQELMREKSRQEDAKRRMTAPDNTLVVDLPRGMQQKISEEQQELSASFIKEAGDLLNTSMALIGGAPLGYMGTKALYDKWKKKQMDDEIAVSNQKYLQALQAIGKSAENTPALDSFCTGVVEKMEKEAGILQKLTAAAGKLKPLMQGKAAEPYIRGSALAGLGGTAVYKDYISKAPQPKSLIEETLNSGQDTLSIIAALAALTSGGLMLHGAQNKEEKSKSKLPSSVALNFKDIGSPVPIVDDTVNPAIA